jgi:hypothetical protein
LRAAARAAAAELTWDRESRVLVDLVDRLARVPVSRRPR